MAEKSLLAEDIETRLEKSGADDGMEEEKTEDSDGMEEGKLGECD